MKKRLLLVILFFYYNLTGYSQNAGDFKRSISFQHASALARSSHKKAMVFADSLVFNSKSSTEIIEASMVSAILLGRSGNYVDAINMANKALNESRKNKFFFSEASILIFLSNQFRLIGYSSKALEFRKEAEKTISKLKLTTTTFRIKGELFMETGESFMERQEYKKALHQFTLAATLYLQKIKNPEISPYYKSKNQYLLGKVNLNLKKYDMAAYHFKKALQYQNLSHTEIGAGKFSIYNGLSSLYQKLNDSVQSQRYFLKSLDYVEQTECFTIRRTAYGNALQFFKNKNDLENIAKYSDKYISVLNNINTNQRSLLQSELLKNNIEYIDNSSPNTVIFLGIGALTLIGFLAFYNKNLIKENFWQIESKPENIETEPGKIKKFKKSNYLPTGTEQALLLKLKVFEAQKKYLDKNMSLPKMTTFMETNAKYLRYLIKEHRNTDFNTYINELRISYILEKLKKDPNYLHYKISYLAEEAGFSSHSKFSKTFKKLTNSAPSDFIQKLKEGLDN